MSIGELASWAEILGGVAVVVSLVYLAIQIRGNSKQAKLNSAISLNHLINEAFDPIYNNDRNIGIWTAGISDPSSLNDQDQAIFSLFVARLVNVLLTAFMHKDHNVLETETAKRYVGSLKSILDSPGGKYWISEMGGKELLSDWALDILEENTQTQSFLTPRSGSA